MKVINEIISEWREAVKFTFLSLEIPCADLNVSCGLSTDVRRPHMGRNAKKRTRVNPVLKPKPRAKLRKKLMESNINKNVVNVVQSNIVEYGKKAVDDNPKSSAEYGKDSSASSIKKREKLGNEKSNKELVETRVSHNAKDVECYQVGLDGSFLPHIIDLAKKDNEAANLCVNSQSQGDAEGSFYDQRNTVFASPDSYNVPRCGIPKPVKRKSYQITSSDETRAKEYRTSILHMRSDVTGNQSRSKGNSGDISRKLGMEEDSLDKKKQFTDVKKDSVTLDKVEDISGNTAGSQRNANVSVHCKPDVFLLMTDVKSPSNTNDITNVSENINTSQKELIPGDKVELSAKNDVISESECASRYKQNVGSVFTKENKGNDLSPQEIKSRDMPQMNDNLAQSSSKDGIVMSKLVDGTVDGNQEAIPHSKEASNSSCGRDTGMLKHKMDLVAEEINNDVRTKDSVSVPQFSVKLKPRISNQRHKVKNYRPKESFLKKPTRYINQIKDSIFTALPNNWFSPQKPILNQIRHIKIDENEVQAKKVQPTAINNVLCDDKTNFEKILTQPVAEHKLRAGSESVDDKDMCNLIDSSNEHRGGHEAGHENKRKLGKNLFANEEHKENRDLLIRPITPLANKAKSALTNFKNIFKANCTRVMQQENKIGLSAAPSTVELRYNTSNISKPSKSIFPEISNANIYKAIINTQIKDSLRNTSKIKFDAKSFTPLTVIPDVNSDDEVCLNQNFKIPYFAKDPKLNFIVKNQDHSEMEFYFGNQDEIDVESIFINVKNVTNDSPNKWTSRN